MSPTTTTYTLSCTNPSGTTTRSATVTVSGGGGGTYTLTASPTSVAAGATITVAWTTPSGGANATDWIGLYTSGAPNTSYQAYRYATGATSGSVTFTAPTTAGTYEFRYLTRNSYISVATSNQIRVQ